MVNSWENIFDRGWVFSVLKPNLPVQNPPLFLLHGLSGDETSLRSLSAKIQRSRWIIAVRGILPGPESGYAWAQPKSRNQTDFLQAVNVFFLELGPLQSLLSLNRTPIDLMGFSQGAAFASVLLIVHPELIRRVALISGFIPRLENSVRPDLSGHQVVISHGTEDNLVPFAEALHSADLLTSFDAEVTFCQSNTRHKIGAYCLSQLETFFD